MRLSLTTCGGQLHDVTIFYNMYAVKPKFEAMVRKVAKQRVASPDSVTSFRKRCAQGEAKTEQRRMPLYMFDTNTVVQLSNKSAPRMISIKIHTLLNMTNSFVVQHDKEVCHVEY